MQSSELWWLHCSLPSQGKSNCTWSRKDRISSGALAATVQEKQRKKNHLQIQALQPPPPSCTHQGGAHRHGQDNAVSGPNPTCPPCPRPPPAPLGNLTQAHALVKTCRHPGLASCPKACSIYTQPGTRFTFNIFKTTVVCVFMDAVDAQDRKRYRGFSQRVTDLLMPSFPGNLPSIARNLFNAVFVVDLASPQGIG